MKRLGIFSITFTLLLSGCGFGTGSSPVTNVTVPTQRNGQSLAPVIEIRPGNIQVPDTEVNCASTLTVEIANTGNTAGSVSAVRINGITELVSNFSGQGVRIPAGSSINIELEFTPTSLGLQRGLLEIEESVSGQTIQAPIYAEAVGPIETSDTFQQTTQSADILLVVDNSCSMFDDIAHLQQQVPQFIHELEQAGVDYHLAVIPFSAHSHGQLAGATPIVTTQTPNPAAVLEANIQAATQSVNLPGERGFETALAVFNNRANAGFRRRGAKLIINFISDEDDQGPDSVEDSIAQFGSPENLIMNAIVGDVPNGCASATPGTRYLQAANRTGGQFVSICSSNWTPALNQLGQFRFQDRFTLSRAPEPSSIEVLVDGITAADTDYVYETSGNQIRFLAGAIPSAGLSIEVRYSDAQSLCGGQMALLEVTPSPLDFGSNNPSCSSSTLTASIRNLGSTPVLVTELAYSPQTSTEFRRYNGNQVSPAILLPQAIRPGQSFDFDVIYAPTDNTPDRGQIDITARGAPVLALPLLGSGTNIPTHREQFSQFSDPKGDVLFVVDTSCSMFDDSSNLRLMAQEAIQHLTNQGIDYKVAVTSMNSNQGRLIGGTPIVTPQTANADRILQANIFPGTTSGGIEQGFSAAEEAINQNPNFLRDDAWLTTIYISDEAEQSGDTVQQAARRLMGLKGAQGAHRVRANAIAEWPTACFGGSPASGTRYAELAQLTGGITDSICGATWSNALTDLGGTGYGLKTNFELQNRADETTLEVIVNGVAIPQTSGSTQNWAYDAPQNSVIFFGPAIPGRGARVVINYDEGC